MIALAALILSVFDTAFLVTYLGMTYYLAKRAGRV